MQSPFFVGDFGLSIRITVADSKGEALPINLATAKEFEIEDPSRNITVVAAAFITDGTDGRLEYILVNGDLDEKGRWKVRAKITEGVAKLFRTEKLEFLVNP